ncbi:MAG: hypothetical protein WC508_01185 [Patescibacteria group bacterium]
MSFKICLIGPIPKGDKARKNWQDWKVKYKTELAKIKNAEFFYGDQWLDETRPFITFGHDSDIIKNSDLVVVYAEEKLGVGTAQEILIAKYFSRPVVVVLPKNSHHRKSNVIFEGELIKDWVNPFIYSTSDCIVNDISQAVVWIKGYQQQPASKIIKDIKIIDEAIEQYNKVK